MHSEKRTRTAFDASVLPVEAHRNALRFVDHRRMLI